MKKLIVLLLIVGICLYSCLAPVPVDVVMADGELFFVLKEPKEIEGIYVTVHLPPLELMAEAEKKENKKRITMWAVEYSDRTKTKKEKYLKLAQIKYAQKIVGFETIEGPFKLERNVKYKVRIEIYGREFASEIFIITDDDKAIMPDPRFTHQRDRTYSVTVDENGNKILALQPISGE